MSPQALVQACAETGKAGAWEEFIRRFHRLIAGVVLRTARRWGETSPAALDDLVQETYLKLCADDCRLLTQFEWQHPDAIYGYLKVVTANIVHDHFKSSHAEKRGAGEVTAGLESAEAAPGGGSGSAEDMEREVLLREIDACLQASGSPTLERDRTIFWLHYRHGLSASAIAALPSIGLTTKGVESTLFRLTRQVRRALGGQVESSEKGFRPAESF